jgi:hypothetical protein
MTTGRPLIGAAVVAALLSVSACGSDDAEPLTKTEFVAQADAICGTATTESEPLWEAFWAGFEEETDGDGGDAMFVRFDGLLDDLDPITDQQLEDLRALEPPADDKEFVEGLLDDFEDGLAEMNDIVDRAVDGDEQAREAMTTEEGDPLADVNEAARDYGLVVCGAED